MSEEENNEDENPADFEEEEFPEDIEEEEDLEDAPLDDDDDDDDEDDESGPTPVADSSEDDDDEDPADVEADLDAILKDRIASGEDDEEEGGDPSTASKKEAPVQGEEDSVEARRKSEVICPSCFLIIEAQIAKETGECPHCGASV